MAKSFETLEAEVLQRASRASGWPITYVPIVIDPRDSHVDRLVAFIRAGRIHG